ncbi:TrmH family RNA methyltransferase [Mycoplasma bradburyae]|uniref:TrmH family RNA methyltransferase n=1 Tax=Mycoplasma bradburyae TaxID=2963128 RepID=UPI0020CF1DBC|nr:RNA methyltransferase [Mycoplasma bradburyae]UTS70609.1 RNA methyltransferase [Mycoplasma bradburyae]
MINFHKINSKANPIYKDLKVAYKNGFNKHISDYFCVGGIKNNLIALNNNWIPHTIFVSKSFDRKIVNDIKNRLKNNSIRWIELSDELNQELKTLNTQAGDCYFYYLIKQLNHQSFELSKKYNYLFLDNIQDPNNLGTILRNAAAFNLDKIFINHSVNLYNPKLIRASAGAVFSNQISVIDDLDNFINVVDKKGLKFVATANKVNAIEVDQFDSASGNIIIFGNEGNGINKRLLDLANTTIKIAINDQHTESLNVATSTGIILYELNKIWKRQSK